MVNSDTVLWESLEKRSSGLFLLAGVLLFGYAVSKAIYTFTDVTPVGAFDVTYGGIGLLVTVFGLLSLYPRLRDSAPWLSLGGIAATLISGILDIALLLQLATMTLQMGRIPDIPADAPAWTVFALFVVFITIFLGFLLFGVASLRTGIFSQRVSVLLLVPAAGWFGLMVANIVLPSGQYLGLLAYAPISVALLSIGYLLRTKGISTTISEPIPG